MCEQFIVLAKHTSSCYIAQCEHGTLHLCWDHVCVHLRPHDFLALTQTIANLNPNQPNHKLRLGIGRLTLELLTEDCQPLTALMRCVAAKLLSVSFPHNEPSKPRVVPNPRTYLN